MLHIECLKDAIEALSQLAQQKQQRFTDHTHIARQWLDDAPPANEVRAQLAILNTPQAEWDGAWPVTDEPIQGRFQVTPGLERAATLIAVDGSQIFPDHHAALAYYLIQVGSLIFHYDGSTPIPQNDASLYYQDEELYDQHGYLISASDVGRERMVKEMLWLAELTIKEQQYSSSNTFALTDGPLLWPYPERGNSASPAFRQYQEALTRIHHVQAIAVGYVDRPGGRSLLDLLWAIQLPPEDLQRSLPATPLQFLSDDRVMKDFLEPGERSAWFKRLNPTNRLHEEERNEIWFCYLNVGSATHPAIARVELPEWAARKANAVDILQAALLHQASVLNGYPYVLARAHEEALVTMQDKAMLENIIQRHLMENGVMVHPSDKFIQKSYLGKR